MAELQRIAWPFPWGGLRTDLDPEYLEPHYLADCTNVYYPDPATLRSRGGFHELYHVGGAVGPMFYWHKDSKLYWGDDATHLYRNGVSVTGVKNDVTDIISFGTAAKPRLIVAEQKVGEDHTLHTWDGTTYAKLVGHSVPNVTKLLPLWGRVLGYGDADNPSRVYYCKVNDVTQWAGAWGEGGFFDVFPDQNGPIIDWGYFRDAVYIVKRYGVYILAGRQPVSWMVSPFEAAFFTMANSIADCNAGVIYGARQGIFTLGRGYGGETHNLSRTIRTQLCPLTTIRTEFDPQLNAYILVNRTSTVWLSNQDNRPDVWTKWTAPATMSSVHRGYELYFGSTGGRVYKYMPDSTSDTALTPALTAITAEFKTPFWDIESPVTIKNIRFIHGALNAADKATLTVSIYADGAAAAMRTYTILAGGQNIIGDVNLNVQRSVALKFNYSTMTGPAYFQNVVLELVPKGRTR